MELDYSALHPTMLYLERGLRLGGDPYLIDRYDRKLVKTATNIRWNAQTPSGARWAIARLFDPPPEGEDKRKNRPSAAAFAEADRLSAIIDSKHAVISDSLGTGQGLRLQHEDSKIMREIQRRCMVKGIPALCIHDFIVVPENMVSLAHEIMQKSFHAVTGSSHCNINLN